MTLLAIDPGRSAKGEASIGWALFDAKGQEIERGELTWEALADGLELSDMGIYGRALAFMPRRTARWVLDEIVIENFVNNEKSRGGQTNGTSECIGSVEIMARKAKTPFKRQAPAALGPAKLHAPKGSWKPLKHLRHEDAAFLHGYEYLVRKGVLSSAGLQGTM